AGVVFQQGPEYLHAEIARQQRLQDLGLVRLVLIEYIGLGNRARRCEGYELLKSDDLRHRRFELVIDDVANVELAGFGHGLKPACDDGSDREVEARPADIFHMPDDEGTEVPAQLITPLAPNAEELHFPS